jgi:hypothetical protein
MELEFDSFNKLLVLKDGENISTVEFPSLVYNNGCLSLVEKGRNLSSVMIVDNNQWEKTEYLENRIKKLEERLSQYEQGILV